MVNPCQRSLPAEAVVDGNVWIHVPNKSCTDGSLSLLSTFGIFLQARTMNRTKCGGAVISELVVSHRAMFRGPVGTSTEPRDWIPRFKGSSATWRWNREVMLPPSAIKVDNRQHEERVVDTE